MRAKVILPAALLAVLIVAPIVYLRFRPAPNLPTPDAGAPVAANTDGAAPAEPAPVPHRQWTSAPPVQAAQDAAADMSAPNHQDYVLNRRNELSELGRSDDPGALKTILSELNNPDPQIRSSALAATVQFGSEDAIPMLKNEFTWAEDFNEKMQIQKAIDFLQLSTASDGMTNDNGSITQQSTDPSAAPVGN